MGQTYRRKETCVFLINYHVVFCPKRRRKILVGPIRDRLVQIIWETAPDLECDVLALEVMPDHVHVFLSATPQWAPNQLVGRIKGKSARLLRHEFPELQRMPSVWTRSSFVSTAGNVSSETIAKYIAEQTTRD
jgi:putative transposase